MLIINSTTYMKLRRRFARSWRCQRVSKRRPNIRAMTLMAVASRPISLILIPRISRSSESRRRPSGKHSSSGLDALGLPSIIKGIIYSSRPISIKCCTSLHTQGLCDARGEQITMRYFEESRALRISSSNNPPLKSVVSLNTWRGFLENSMFGFFFRISDGSR